MLIRVDGSACKRAHSLPRALTDSLCSQALQLPGAPPWQEAHPDRQGAPSQLPDQKLTARVPISHCCLFPPLEVLHAALGARQGHPITPEVQEAEDSLLRPLSLQGMGARGLLAPSCPCDTSRAPAQTRLPPHPALSPCTCPAPAVLGAAWGPLPALRRATPAIYHGLI